MNIPRIKKTERWLLVFVGGVGDEDQIVRNSILKASELIKRNPPVFNIEYISVEKARQIPSVRCVANEVAETFNEVILNEVVAWKGKYNATQIAIIFPSKAFSSDDVFVQVVNDRIFLDSIYHAICSRESFLATERRKQCAKSTTCTQCDELVKGCVHSCLIRLIWLMFEGKDDRIMEIFDVLGINEFS